MRLLAGALVAVSAALAACSSAGPSGASTASAAPSVVDGITIPPPYVPPTPTVVPGPSSCPAAFAAALDAAASRGSFTLSSDRAAHLLTCSYRNSRAATGDCSAATVRVNTEPQAFTAFDRWNVETGQNSMWSNDPKLQPLPVSGIGIEAEWVPALRELAAGDATTWVSVFLSCPGSAQRPPALAETLAKAGLASAC